MMFFCRRIPLRLLLLPVLAIGFCTVCADQMDLISSSDELINNPEGGSLQYTNPGSWTPTSSEADINDVNIGISPSIMVYKSAGVGVGGPGGPDAGLAENSINAIDNCAKVPKNSRRGVQLRKKRHAPDWCDEKQKPAPFSGHSGGDSDDDGTNISNPTRQAPPKTKPILKPKPAGDTNIQQQQQQPPPTTRSEAEESSIKDLQEVFLRLGGGSICNTELEYFRYRYPVCYPYAMGGKGRPFSVSRATRAARFGLTLESAYLRKDIFPCRPSKLWKRKKTLYFRKKKKKYAS